MAITVALDPNNTGAQNKLELQKALDSYQGRGGEIRLPRSNVAFNIDPGCVSTKRNIEIVGDGSASGYDAGFGGTQLKATSGGSPILELHGVTQADPAASYAVVRNVSFHGNDVCETALRVHGCVGIYNVEARNATQAGIHLATWINATKLEDVSLVGNGNLGLWVGGNGVKNNTVFYARNLKVRSNLKGIRIENAMGFSFRDCVIESNYQDGLQIYRPLNTDLSDGLFDNCWFEGNWRGADGYAITSGCESTDQRPQNMKFVNNTRISSGNLAKSMNLQAAERWYFDDLIVNGTPAIVLGANTLNCGFVDGPAAAVITNSGTGNWFNSRNGGGTVVNNYYTTGGSGGPLVFQTTTLTDASQTLPAAQMVNGGFEIFPTGMRTLTTDTAANIITQMGGFVQNKVADMILLNRASGGGIYAQVLGGTGVIIRGNNMIDQGSGQWKIIQKSATEVELWNISAK